MHRVFEEGVTIVGQENFHHLQSKRGAPELGLKMVQCITIPKGILSSELPETQIPIFLEGQGQGC